jgi:hypothetical protein
MLLALARKSRPVVVVAKFDRQGTGSHHLDAAMAKGWQVAPPDRGAF